MCCDVVTALQQQASLHRALEDAEAVQFDLEKKYSSLEEEMADKKECVFMSCSLGPCFRPPDTQKHAHTHTLSLDLSLDLSCVT